MDKTFLLYDKDKVCWKICTAPQDCLTWKLFSALTSVGRYSVPGKEAGRYSVLLAFYLYPFWAKTSLFVQFLLNTSSHIKSVSSPISICFPQIFFTIFHLTRQDATAILAVSRSSEVWSPELTTWEGPVLQAIDLNSPVAQEILETLGKGHRAGHDRDMGGMAMMTWGFW